MKITKKKKTMKICNRQIRRQSRIFFLIGRRHARRDAATLQALQLIYIIVY